MLIAEDYVSYETAKLLKEKGFDEATHQYYKTITYLGTEANNVCIKTLDGIESDPFNNSIYGFDLNGADTGEYACPTLQMAMKWLRKEHNMIIIPSIRVTDPITGIIDCYCVGIYYIPKNNGGALCFTSPTPGNGYSTYEEACEAGIKYCLENLI